MLSFAWRVTETPQAQLILGFEFMISYSQRTNSRSIPKLSIKMLTPSKYAYVSKQKNLSNPTSSWWCSTKAWASGFRIAPDFRVVGPVEFRVFPIHFGAFRPTGCPSSQVAGPWPNIERVKGSVFPSNSNWKGIMTNTTNIHNYAREACRETKVAYWHAKEVPSPWATKPSPE